MTTSTLQNEVIISYKFPSKFIVENNIVRFCAYNQTNSQYSVFSTFNNGEISNITDNSITINWGDITGSIQYNLINFSNNNYIVQKNIGDDDWIDHSGNHYNNNADEKQPEQNETENEVIISYEFPNEFSVVNNIIRFCSYSQLNSKYSVCSTFNNGIISNITDNSITIKWGNINGSIQYNPINFSNNNYIVQKKAGDNDWIDKDGNHYNNAGDKQ